MSSAPAPDAPYPDGIPPDVTPVDVLIDRLGDEARQQGETLLDSAEARAEDLMFKGLCAALVAWLVFRK